VPHATGIWAMSSLMGPGRQAYVTASTAPRWHSILNNNALVGDHGTG